MRRLLPPLLLAILAAAGTARAFDHSSWDALLSEHVSQGLVDYAGFSRHRPRLEAYLAGLAAARGLEAWSREERLAFWINAYNARMVALVLQHRPIHGDDPAHPADSVLQVEGLFDRLTGEVAGLELSLDRIENEKLRAAFDEPRIHFALVCASRSCPELRAEAYVAARLDEQLDDQARRFLSDPDRNRFDVEAGVAQLSRLFDWYGGDFARFAPSGAGEGAGALAFAARYLQEPARSAAASGRLRVDYLPYDWSLNAATR